MIEARPLRTPPPGSAWSLGIERPGGLAFFAVAEPPPGEGGFRVETLFSGFSAGTELSYVKGTNPYLSSCWDVERCVFADGTPSTAYPVPVIGYMEVARVVESRTPSVPRGQVVAMRYGHKSRHTAGPEDLRIPLPPDVDPVLGIYAAHMGPICANGLLHAAADVSGRSVGGLGDGVRDQRVLVVGAGVVGLLTGLFARHHGAAEVVVADPTPTRLAAAVGLGLATVDEGRVEAWRFCKDRWAHGPGDRGADLVFQCRGRSASLAGALRALRPQRTVIDLAFYQGGAGDLRLGEEFHHNGLTVRCAQISRVPRGLAGEWDRTRLAAETVELLRSHGEAVKAALITDVVPAVHAPAVVADLADRRRHALQVVFDFTTGPDDRSPGPAHRSARSP